MFIGYKIDLTKVINKAEKIYSADLVVNGVTLTSILIKKNTLTPVIRRKGLILSKYVEVDLEDILTLLTRGYMNLEIDLSKEQAEILFMLDPNDTTREIFRRCSNE